MGGRTPSSEFSPKEPRRPGSGPAGQPVPEGEMERDPRPPGTLGRGGRQVACCSKPGCQPGLQIRARAGSNRWPDTFSRAGENNASRRSLAPRAAKVHCAIRLAWDWGSEWWGCSMYALLATRQISVSISLSVSVSFSLSLLPPPPLPRPLRPPFWKGNSHCGSTWDLERVLTVTPRRRVSTCIIFSRTSPTCLLLNVRVMGSASDKTAYYS